MKTEKQKLVLSILETGIYEIDTINGVVYSNRKRGKIQLKPRQLPTGYKQILLFKGRRTGVKCLVYLHQLVYLAHYGEYPDGYEIDHIDRDKNNCSYTNLKAKTTQQNHKNRAPRKQISLGNLIRSKEIALIRKLHSEGNSQAGIARKLYLNRISVRYIIKRIEACLPLKYETEL